MQRTWPSVINAHNWFHKLLCLIPREKSTGSTGTVCDPITLLKISNRGSSSGGEKEEVEKVE